MHLLKAPRLSSLCIVALLAVTSGCGYKNDPIPPQSVVPKPIKDLSYTLQDDGAHLSWTYPDETVKGRDLSDIAEFDLYRAEIPLDGYCPDCPIPFGRPVEVAGGPVGDQTLARGEYTSGLLRSGTKYFFKVRSRTSWLAASDDSNIVSFVYHTPAAAPQNVQLVAQDRAIIVRWDAVHFLDNGKPVDLPVTYQVYKSNDNKEFSSLGSSRSSLSLKDTNVQSGKTYYYKVRSGMSFEDEAIDGSWSDVKSITMRDTVPPAQVTGVRVIPAANNVRVFWNGVRADDLAGYYIYKRTDRQTKPVRMGKVGKTQTIWVDTKTVDGSGFYYSVSAFDKDGNEGQRSQESTPRY